ncbi:MAG: hypothetical protein K6F07_03565 [Bacilli bacterium]|nr:hypothetical protein [Bacilli bacterium]
MLSTISLVSCASRQLENNNSHNLDVSSVQIKASDSGLISQALTYEEILNKAITGEETKIILVAKTYNYSGGRSRTVIGTDPYANFYFEEVPYNEEEYLYLDDNISICSSGVMEMSLTYSDSAIKATFLSYGVMQYLSGEFTFSDYKADAVEYTIINNSGEINLMDPSGAYLYYDSDNGLGQNDIPSDFAFYPIDDYFVNTYNVWGWMLNSFDDSDASTLLSQYRQITALDKYFIQAYIEASAAGAVTHEGDVANNWSTFTSHFTTYQNMTSGNFTCGDVSSSDLTINYEKLQFELTGDVDNLFYMDATSGDYSSLEKTLSGGWDFGTAQISGTIYLKYGANLDYADTFSENALEVTVNQTINIEASEYAFTTKTYTVGTNDTVLALLMILSK